MNPPSSSSNPTTSTSNPSDYVSRKIDQDLYSLNQHLVRELEEKEREIAALQDETSKGVIQQKLQRALLDNKDLRKRLDEIRGYETTALSAGEEKHSLLMELESLKNELNRTKSDYETLLVRVQQDNTELQHRLHVTETKLGAYERETGEMEDEIATLQKDKLDLKQDVQKLRVQLQAFKSGAHLAELEEKLTSVQQLLQERDQENTTLLKEMGDLHTENTSLRELQTKHLNEVATVHQTNQQRAERAIQEKQSEITLLQEELKKRDDRIQQFETYKRDYDTLLLELRKKMEEYERGYNLSDAVREIRELKVQNKKFVYDREADKELLNRREKELQKYVAENKSLREMSNLTESQSRAFNLNPDDLELQSHIEIQQLKARLRTDTQIIKKLEDDRTELLDQLRKSAYERTESGMKYYGLTEEQTKCLEEYRENLLSGDMSKVPLTDLSTKLQVEVSTLAQQLELWKERYARLQIDKEEISSKLMQIMQREQEIGYETILQQMQEMKKEQRKLVHAVQKKEEEKQNERKEEQRQQQQQQQQQQPQYQQQSQYQQHSDYQQHPQSASYNNHNTKRSSKINVPRSSSAAALSGQRKQQQQQVAWPEQDHNHVVGDPHSHPPHSSFTSPPPNYSILLAQAHDSHAKREAVDKATIAQLQAKVKEQQDELETQERHLAKMMEELNEKDALLSDREAIMHEKYTKLKEKVKLFGQEENEGRRKVEQVKKQRKQTEDAIRKIQGGGKEEFPVKTRRDGNGNHILDDDDDDDPLGASDDSISVTSSTSSLAPSLSSHTAQMDALLSSFQLKLKQAKQIIQTQQLKIAQLEKELIYAQKLKESDKQAINTAHDVASIERARLLSIAQSTIQTLNDQLLAKTQRVEKYQQMLEQQQVKMKERKRIDEQEIERLNEELLKKNSAQIGKISTALNYLDEIPTLPKDVVLGEEMRDQLKAKDTQIHTLNQEVEYLKLSIQAEIEAREQIDQEMKTLYRTSQAEIIALRQDLAVAQAACKDDKVMDELLTKLKAEMHVKDTQVVQLEQAMKDLKAAVLETTEDYKKQLQLNSTGPLVSKTKGKVKPIVKTSSTKSGSMSKRASATQSPRSATITSVAMDAPTSGGRTSRNSEQKE